MYLYIVYSGYSIVFQVNNLKKLVKGVHDYYTEVCTLEGFIDHVTALKASAVKSW